MSYVLERLEEIKAKLAAMPALEGKREVSTKQDAIAVVAPGIAAMQKRGYTLEQIAQALTDEGIEIKTATLKNYLARLKRQKGKRRGATTPPQELAPTGGGDEGGGEGKGAVPGPAVAAAAVPAAPETPVSVVPAASTAKPPGEQATFGVREDSREI